MDGEQINYVINVCFLRPKLSAGGAIQTSSKQKMACRLLCWDQESYFSLSDQEENCGMLNFNNFITVYNLVDMLEMQSSCIMKW